MKAEILAGTLYVIPEGAKEIQSLADFMLANGDLNKCCVLNVASCLRGLPGMLKQEAIVEPEAEGETGEAAPEKTPRELLVAQCEERGIEVKKGARDKTLIKLIEEHDKDIEVQAALAEMEANKPEEPEELTIAEVKDRCVAFMGILGKEKGEEVFQPILKGLGATKFTEVKPEQYGALVAQIDAAQANFEKGEEECLDNLLD